MLEIYGINELGLVPMSKRGIRYNKRTAQQMVKNVARKAMKEEGKST